jgi:hypothetical protein
MELQINTHSTEERFPTIEATSKQTTYERYNSAVPRQPLKSAGITSHTISTISQGFHNNTKKRLTSTSFLKKMDNFMSIISKSKK